MSDVQDDIKALKEALAAGPTPGPWYAEDCTIDDGEDRINAAFIAAASPDRIQRLIDHVERRTEACQRHGHALQRAGTAIGLDPGSDMHRDLVPAIERLTADLDEAKADYLQACGTIAEMHAAAVGETGTGPRRGVVEDVADLRADRDELRKDAERIAKIADRAQATTFFRDPGGAELVVAFSIPDGGRIIKRPTVGTAHVTADELRAVIDAMEAQTGDDA